jgi:hypothetical protein
MKLLMCVMAVGLLMNDAVRAERPGSKGKSHGKSRSVASDHRGSDVEIHVVFSRREADLIREHYAPRYRNLPPGLQKKLSRTGQLPPGWQKKLEPFPPVVERHLLVLPAGYARGVLDGHAVIYNQKTQRIVDLRILF